VNLGKVDASWRCKLRNRTLALALEPNIMVNSTNMSWQRVCLLLKLYIFYVDDQTAA
jgi:hypothetical protein